MIVVQASYGFGAGGAGVELLRGDWATPQADGVWSTGGQSGLAIPVEPARGALSVELTLDPQEIFGITRHRHIAALVSGRVVAESRRGGGGRWRIGVPEPAGGIIDLVLRVLEPGPPDARGCRLAELQVLRDTHALPPTPMRPLHELDFGWSETTENALSADESVRRDEWGTPEDGFVWSIGGISTLQVPVPADGAPMLALLDMRPHRREGAEARQRVVVFADGVEVAGLDLRERLVVAVKLRPAPGQMSVTLTFHNPDANFATSEPYYHFGKPFAWALSAVRVVPALPRYLPAMRPPVRGRLADGSMQAAVRLLTGLDAALVAACFEGLGNGCELGQLQQKHQDRSGLLRFVAVRQRELVEGLFHAFNGVGRFDRLEWTVRREADDTWRLVEASYGLSSATGYSRSEPPPAEGKARAAKRLPRLADKLMEDVAAGEKIFVLRFSEPGGDEAASAVLAALRHYGEADMVWLVTDGSLPPGSAERLECGLIRGHLESPASGVEVTGEAMLSALANAYVLLRQAQRLAPV